jgi:hypothetical protein
MTNAKSKTVEYDPKVDAEVEAKLAAVSGPIDMEAALDLEAPGWKPEPDEKLIGTVVYTSTTSGSHPEYGDYPIVMLITDDGELRTLHAFHSVLRNAVERQAPAAGDRIGIKYKGRKTEGGQMGTGYEDYNVIVTKQPSNQSALPAGE